MISEGKPKAAHVFPGQGTQGVGMGRNLYKTSPIARVVFDQADAVLSFPLSRLCFEGPEEELRQTSNAQPAIFTLSVACLRVFQLSSEEGARPVFVAGHSLGEYTALVAAGALDFPDALPLVQKRGQSMQEAGEKIPGGMAAVLGLDLTVVAEVCQETGAEIANINCPGQIVITGSKEELSRAGEMAKTKGARRVIPLEISGAFHSRWMQPALERMSPAISSLPWRHPQVPVVGNTVAQPLTTPEEIKEELQAQLCNCVCWQRSVEYMVMSGVSTFIEIGPGRVLTGLIKRIDKNVQTINIGETSSP